MDTTGPAVVELRVPGSPDTWSELGFTVADGLIRLGRCSIRPGASHPGLGVVPASDTPDTPADWLGLPLEIVEAPPPTDDEGPSHPNRITGTDHVVLFTPDLGETERAVATTGWEIRRQRPTRMMGSEVVQSFVWAGRTLLEIVSPAARAADRDSARSATLWGVSLVSEDLDATVRVLGGRIGAPRDAVQPGRRIATVRRPGTDLGVEVAVMTPHV